MMVSTRREWTGLRWIYTGVPSLLLVLVASLNGVTYASCPGAIALMTQAEQCSVPLSQPENDTLVGAMTAESWKKSCHIYNKSVRCVKKVLKKCDDDEVSAEVGDSILTALRSGMGRLCENNQTYIRYLRHNDCFANNNGASQKCLMKFSNDVRDVMTSDTHNDKQCSSYNEMIVCVNKIIETNCGTDAADLFNDLIRAKIPSQVIAPCVVAAAAPTERLQHRSAAWRMVPHLGATVCNALLFAQYIFIRIS